MPRLKPDTATRTVSMETQTRSIDLPVDGTGHLRRVHTVAPTITRAAGSGGEVRFEGDFIPFGQPQWIGSKRWGYWEINVAGSINKTIQERVQVNNDITFNRDHDNKLLLARMSNGTLRLSANEQYGHAEAEMGDYSYTRDIEVALARQDLTGMSYAFDMIDWSWDVADDGYDRLWVREMGLYDVAVVGMPANVDTTAGLRMDLLACARSAGMEASSFDALARRLADPDPEVLTVLRSLAQAPEETRDDVEDEVILRTMAHPLSIATLAKRHQDLEGRMA